MPNRNEDMRTLVYWQDQAYDVTDFVPYHPGGSVLKAYHLQSVDKVMNSASLHKHSKSAYDLLEQFRIETPPFDIPDDKKLHVVHETVKHDSESFLNLDQPILAQMMKWNGPGEPTMKRETYLKQVHRPNFPQRPLILFANHILERLTRTPWYIIPLVWLPVDFMLMYQCLHAVSMVQSVFLYTCGCCIWTVFEYGMHRFLFHLDNRLPQWKWAYILHFLLHGIHHHAPHDKDRLVFPPVLGFAIFALMWYFFRNCLNIPFDINCGLFSGGVTGYIVYDLMHYALHHGTGSMEKIYYLKQLRTHHMLHHYEDYQRGFGVSSRLWDRCLGTEYLSKSS